MHPAFRNLWRAAPLAVIAALLIPVSASAATTLAGETFTAPFDFFSVNGTCNATGPSTFTFNASGPAVGPAGGTFYEGTAGQPPGTGTITLASPTGPVTNFRATFTIKMTGQPDVVGSKTLTSATVAVCTPNQAFSDLHIEGVTSYTVTAPFVESGTAPLTLNFAFPGTFIEGPFAAGPPPQQPGCDTQGQSNGDDQCQQ